MEEAHKTWIEKYLSGFSSRAACLGRCHEAVTAMNLAFPDLTKVRGHVHCPQPWGKRGHWWLTTADGTIVDPTVEQFTAGIYEYEPYKEGDDVRLGACMDCGEMFWGPIADAGKKTFCNSTCEARTRAYLKTGRL